MKRLAACVQAGLPQLLQFHTRALQSAAGRQSPWLVRSCAASHPLVWVVKLATADAGVMRPVLMPTQVTLHHIMGR